MYRWHVMDPIRFEQDLRVTIQALGWRPPLDGEPRYLAAAGRHRLDRVLVPRPMKIAEIVTTVVGTPWRELTFVELVADDGRRGLGEVRMVNKTDTLLACIGELGERYVVGTDPFEVERLAWTSAGPTTAVPARSCSPRSRRSRSACWDLIGQELGVPVWKLLGGRFHERVPAYANGWYQVDREPAAIAELRAAVVARGYRGLKLDPFGAASRELSPAELAAATRSSRPSARRSARRRP